MAQTYINFFCLCNLKKKCKFLYILVLWLLLQSYSRVFPLPPRARPPSSGGRALGYSAKGRGFEPRLKHQPAQRRPKIKIFIFASGNKSSVLLICFFSPKDSYYPCFYDIPLESWFVIYQYIFQFIIIYISWGKGFCHSLSLCHISTNNSQVYFEIYGINIPLGS